MRVTLMSASVFVCLYLCLIVVFMTFEEIEVANCVKILQTGGTLLYPTDTIWGIGCDATRRESVSRVYRIKARDEDRSFIILLSDPAQLARYVEEVPATAYDLLAAVNDSPLTIIYPKGRNLAENVLGRDSSIAIRIVHNTFCKALLTAFGKPIVSTSANISGEPSPMCFSAISPHIVSSVDHVAVVHEDTIAETKPSRIIKLEVDGMFKVVRA